MTTRSINTKSTPKYGRPGCKEAVWAKLKIIRGKNPNIWRKDAGNNILHFDDHGKIASPHGWDIDHIIPKAQGGSDEIENLQALHYTLNRACGMRLDKPGLDPMDLHEMRKMILYDRMQCHIKSTITPLGVLNVQRCKRSQICEGRTMYVKATPLTRANLANILHIDRINKRVTIKWLDSNYKQDVIYDTILFEQVEGL